MLQIQGKLDNNDLEYASKRFRGLVAGLPAPYGKGGKINPHVSRFLNKDGQRVSVFHIKPVYYENHIGQWRPMSEIAEYYGNHKIVLKSDWDKSMHPRYLNWLMKRMEILKGNIFIPSPKSYFADPVKITRENVMFTTTTVYPDPSPETTTFDGFGIAGGSGTWDVVHDSATSNITTQDANVVGGVRTERRGDSTYRILRSIHLFDTSAVGSDTVDSATHSLYGSSTRDDDNDAEAFVAIVSSTPASNTAIAAGDFDAVGDAIDDPTEMHDSGERADITSFSTSAYTDFDFNATGIATIDGSGVSKYGVREGHDITDTLPVLGGGQQITALTHSADATGTSTDPKFVAVHSAGSTFTPVIINY